MEITSCIQRIILLSGCNQRAYSWTRINSELKFGGAVLGVGNADLSKNVVFNVINIFIDGSRTYLLGRPEDG